MGRAGEGARGHAPEDGRVDTSEVSGGLCLALASGRLDRAHHCARGKSSSVQGWRAGGRCADPRSGPVPPLCATLSSSESASGACSSELGPQPQASPRLPP